jgi:hypothetical protein
VSRDTKVEEVICFVDPVSVVMRSVELSFELAIKGLYGG